MGLTARLARGASDAQLERQPRSVLLFTSGLTAAGVVCAMLAARFGEVRPTPSTPVLLGFLVALSAAASLNLEYHYRGQVDALDLFDAVLAPALFVLPPVAAVLLAAVSKAVSQAARGVRPVKAAFNIGQWTAAAGAGAVTFAVLRPAGEPSPHQLPALVLAMLVVALVNLESLLLVLSLAQHRPLRRWLTGAPAGLLRGVGVPTGVTIAFGILFTGTYAWAPAIAPLFVVPLGLLHWAHRGYALARVEEARLRGLQAATSVLAAPADPRAAFAAFLETVGRHFDREAVDLAVTGAGGLTIHSWRRSGPQPSPGGEDRVGQEALVGHLAAVPEPMRAERQRADPELGALMEAAGWQDVAAAPLPLDAGVGGVLCLYDQRGAAALPERELAVIAALAREAAAAVDKAALIQEVVDERAKLAQIVNETADGIFTLGRDGQVRSWNPALVRITGWTAAAVTGRPVAELHPQDVAGAAVPLAAWAAHGPLPAELRLAAGDGRPCWVSCSYAVARDGGGEPDRLIVVARDVTALKTVEARLAGQTTVLELIAAGASLLRTLEVLAEEVVAALPEVGCAIVLEVPDEPGRLRVGAARGVTAETLEVTGCLQAAADGGWTGLAVVERRDVLVLDVARGPASAGGRAVAQGAGIAAAWAVPVIADDAGRAVGAVLLTFDRPQERSSLPDRGVLDQAAHLTAIAAARAESEARLEHQATHDALTGLPNRLVFQDRCSLALHRARRQGSYVVALFLDLDRFKVVNDSLGHDTGDQLLIAVAHRLNAVVRPGDTVARFGGDEFTMLCEGITDHQHVVDLAGRVRRALAAPFALGGGEEVFVTASIGISLSAGGGDSATLVEGADAAMYRAKERGGNRYELYDEAMRERATLRLATQSAMHRALERAEFVVHYQPTVSLLERRMTGVEALLRWRHPERGMLAPGAFLELAESSGLVVPIGTQVLYDACRQARSWSAAGVRLEMSINLSARQFAQPNLSRLVAHVLSETGVEPSRVCLEITESAVMDDAALTATAMRELKALGVRLAIDDFGTGYSSLTYLKRFPVDELKVDRSFVSGVDSDPEDAAIVAAVIDLAHSLGLVAVAEGVERPGQADRLRALGCDIAQGYYFGRPQPAEQLALGGAAALSGRLTGG